MNRLLKFERGVIDPLNAKKYLFIEGDETASLYQEVCPSGYLHQQSWLMVFGENYLVCGSFNNYLKEEVLDILDEYRETGSFSVKGFAPAGRIPYMHPNGAILTFKNPVNPKKDFRFEMNFKGMTLDARDMMLISNRYHTLCVTEFILENFDVSVSEAERLAGKVIELEGKGYSEEDAIEILIRGGR